MVYFAYGSNLCLDKMKSICKYAIPMVSVHLNDYKLIYNKYADIIPCKDEVVYGAIYEISLDDFKNLEKHKRILGSYNRAYFTVKDKDGNSYEAFTYVMNKKGDEPSKKEYLDIINKGYNDWGIIY